MMRKNSFRLCVLLSGLSLFFLCHFWACTNDNLEDLTHVTECDTLNVSYKTDVKPVLEMYCLTCHGIVNAPTAGAGIVFEEYSDLKNYIENVKRFSGAINRQEGFSPMPKGQNQLPACELAKLNKWLEDGHPDN